MGIHKSFKRAGMALGLTAALVASIAGPAGAADSTVTQVITGGSLSASIADLTLGSLTYSHSERPNTGTLTLDIDDSSGTGAGWSVTVESSDFVLSGGDGSTNISADKFSITDASAITRSEGQGIDGENGPKVGAAATGQLNQSRTVIQAAAGYGQGTYSQELDVSLTVPAYSRAGTYTATVTTTINAAP